MGPPLNDFIARYFLFLAETATLVLAAIGVFAGLVALSRRRSGDCGRLRVSDVGRRFAAAGDEIRSAQLDKGTYRPLRRARGRRRKARTDTTKTTPCSYLLDFKGDIRATAVAALREEVSAILEVARAGDAVLVRLESGGGLVHRYGLGAAQLLRIRDAQLPLTVMVDSVATSGGYLMAAVADTIVASPFALVGSIGVVAQTPNFHRWLRARDIDWEQFTAGQYKRTVTLFGENTETGRAKLREELDDIHALFRQFVQDRRPRLDVDTVATGETWLGSRALELGLVDQIATSDEIIRAACRRGKVLQLNYQHKTRLAERVGRAAQAMWDGIWQPPQPLR